MNELHGYLGLGGGGHECGSESGVLNSVLHSQALLVSEGGVTYSQASVVIILCFFLDTVFVLFCVIVSV
jgi:hypothetical protein